MRARGKTDIIEGIKSDDGVLKATCDQCMFGCAGDGGDPVKKPTSFMTNAPELARELTARCNGRGKSCGRPEGGHACAMPRPDGSDGGHLSL